MPITISGRIGHPSSLSVGALAAPVVPAVALSGGPVALVEFLIDTGAGGRVLHPQQALAVWPEYLSYDFDNDSTLGDSQGVGGSAQYITRAASLSFVADDGTVETITLRIAIGRPTPPNALTGQPGNLHFPALLGRDALARYRFVMDMGAGLVTLSR